MRSADRCPDPVLLMAAGLACGAPLVLAPWPTLAVLLAAALTWWPRARRAVLATLVLAAAGAVAAGLSLDHAGGGYAATLRALPEPTDCRMRARIVQSPVVLRAGRAGRGEGDARIDVEVLAAACPLVADTRVRLYGAPEDLARGDVIEVEARLAPVRLFHNPGLPDPRVRVALTGVTASGTLAHVYARQPGEGVLAWVDRARARVRSRIEATFAPRVAPFARALVLGESDLDDGDRNAFRASGLAHLLAVSGTHLVIAVVALVRALQSILVRIGPLARAVEPYRIASALAVPAAWLYAELAGGGGSAYRAALMLALAMLARAWGRRPSALRCFALSIALGALIEPLALCDLSFALSVAATGGLLSAHRPVARAVSRHPRWLRAPAAAMLATLAATVACAPVLLGAGPQVPLLGVAANVLAAPVGELVALPVCLAHAVLWWAPAAERGAARIAGGALEVVSAIAHSAAASPGATLELPPPDPRQLAAAAIAALLWWQRRRAWILLAGALAVGALELVVRAEQSPTGELRVTVLDVGQGDALLVDLPDGRLMAIDGGGLVGSPVDTGERVLLEVLRARRRKRVDIAVLSHPHPDHYTGFLSALPRLEVGELWWSGLEERRPGRLASFGARLAERGTVIERAADLCAAPRRFGAARLTVLSPCPEPDEALGANDNSLVLRIELGDKRVLLTGDAEREAEALLVARHGDALRADLLKVGHHGSRTSTGPAFVAAVRPSLAVISCGVRNRFGHPHPETLATLRRARAFTLRTDIGGAVIWQTDGKSVRFEQLRALDSQGVGKLPAP